MSVRCAGCGLEYAGQRGAGGAWSAGVRPAAGATCGCWPRSRASTAGARRLLAAGGDDRPHPGRVPRTPGGFSRYFRAHFALPLVAAVWSCPPGTALQLPGPLPVRVPGQPRDALGHGLAAVAHRDRRIPQLRRADRHADRRGADLGPGPRRAPVPGRRRGARRRRRHGRVRRGRHRDPRRSGPAPAGQADPGRAGGARRVPLHLQPGRCCTPTPGCCPARPRVRASWNYQLSRCDWPGDGRSGRTRISYDMNRLQGLAAARTTSSLWAATAPSIRRGSSTGWITPTRPTPRSRSRPSAGCPS